MATDGRIRETNRKAWDLRASVHVSSPFYAVDAFVERGELSLRPPERALVGDVNGKHLLHLQCHFGLDTLSWARLGAHATGVDFSAVSIEMAQRLSEESGTPARFVCADVQELSNGLGT